MKQELRVPHAARTRVVSRVKDPPRTDTDHGTSPGLKARPKSSALDASTANLARRRSPQFNNNLRPATNGLGAPKVVEQFARLGRREDASCKGSADGVNGKIKELESRLGESEKLVRELQQEVTELKTEIEKLQEKNVELESQNKKLEQDLTAAEENIKMMEKNDQVELDGKSKFRDLLELVQKNSKNSAEMEEVQQNVVIKMPIPTLSPSKGASHGPPPLPPPPPPLPHSASGRATVGKASALVQLYHSLTKQGSASNGGSASPFSGFAHRGIVGELQHRSAHLLAIKADVETKGPLIKHLIQKVLWSSFTSMEDVLAFVDWLDGELSTLADERAVLKHFDWPEKRADALREAAVEFRGLKQLEAHVHSLKDDSSLSCEVTLKKISNLLDNIHADAHDGARFEQGVDRLIKLRNANMMLYKECKIPTDWMLDSGMVNQMKQSSVKLARLYLSRATMELKVFQHSERQSAQEALLLQGVKFAYRTRQASKIKSKLLLSNLSNVVPDFTAVCRSARL
ncbi:protein CHUP1, chloroplastic-like isoform X1 [Zingiber officinale]|uniref:protein CHUP1, chloroplastic-like isoform X1 n=1 Tax=Zingiber officinale TaxID=94328 RepID=UPI001C4BC2AC|nr:protein CHUP1, chloroplastic-like isoform X1 [Zingiber officinale]XP_042457503.1 protein CHUP1, chloroplastic-like isoform X1 [Zingiber officinale]